METIQKENTKAKTLNKEYLKKQFRFSDWFAEKFIKSIAFFSIAFVVLIFLFVFRETLPIFSGNQNKTKKSEQNKTDTIKYQQPESYSSVETKDTVTQETPEVYGETNENKITTTQPEQYTINSDTSQTAELKPEVYGTTNDSTTISTENKPEQYGNHSEENTNFINNSTIHYHEEATTENALSTLSSADWQPVSDKPRYGLIPLILGTLKVTLLAILFAAPIAILAAIYTSMFAPRRLREYIKPIIELLAGFPSVVIGFFALMVLATFFQDLFGYSSRLNAFVGGIAMGLAAIPVIYTLTEDALMAVPKTYIEASLGLGASIRQTAFKVILPAATPGIFAAILLGIGRVFGETMIALMATGNASLISANPFDSVRTLSATIGAEMAEVVFGDTHYSILFLIGSLLFIFTFALNAIAEFYFKSRIIKRIQGK